MELTRKHCRLCLSETDFNVSLHGDYCRRSNMIEKIRDCLKIVIETRERCDTICFKCAENVERYHEFISKVNKCQTRYYEKQEPRFTCDPDYSFSFLELPKNDDKRHSKASSPFFSYFSPPNVLLKQSCELEVAWGKPNSPLKKDHRYKNRYDRHHSRDLFESQSQDDKSLDWKLTPDDNLIKRIKEKCFGRAEY